MKKRHSIICASYLFLLQDNKILLLRRFNTGYEDGNYSIPAGHVDKGESISYSLIREIKEEIDIDIDKTNIELSHIMHRRAIETNDERLDFFFICKNWSGKVKNMEPHKCDDLIWCDINELPDNIIPYIQDAISNYINKIIYSEKGW